MSKPLGQTAILIFSRSASQEARVKTFDQRVGKKGNRSIAQRLIRHTLATAQKTRIPTFFYGSNAQFAHSFGENLANAFESVFAKGFSKVIAIGNDCPNLSASLLLDANQVLAKRNLVLGPATDGGVYLIGLTKSAYQRQGFVGLPWETAQLQGAWHQYQAEIIWLEPHDDIDYAIDFESFIKGLPTWSQLKKQLLDILESLYTLVLDRPNIASVALHGATQLRGPPVY
jgi:glycosyltransferase A (GT-A) superfamily protein (DUF2064 family)